MRRIIIISHGELAKGALNTLGMFTSATQNITAICGYVDECDPKTELERIMSEMKEEDQIIIFTDLYGGSVNHLAMPYISRPNTFLFAGFNLPMLFEAAFLKEDADAKEIRELADLGKKAIVFMNDYKFEPPGEEDE